MGLSSHSLLHASCPYTTQSSLLKDLWPYPVSSANLTLGSFGTKVAQDRDISRGLEVGGSGQGRWVCGLDL